MCRLAVTALLLALGWGCTDVPMGPGVDPFCSERPDSARPTFGDANLEAAIKTALLVLPWDDLTCGQVTGIVQLDASYSGIANVAGIENLTALTSLRIRGNSIADVTPLSRLGGLTTLNLAENDLSEIGPLSALTDLTFLAINDNGGISDIGPLSGLTKLEGTLWLGGNSIVDLLPLNGLTRLTGVNAWDNSIADLTGLGGLSSVTELRLHSNAITDLSALSGLTGLDVLWLHSNPDLQDVQPLLDNVALGAGMSLNVTATRVRCADVSALEGRGVVVISDCS